MMTLGLLHFFFFWAPPPLLPTPFLGLLHAKCSMIQYDIGPDFNMALIYLVLRARQFQDEPSSSDKRLHLPKCDR